MGSCCLPIIRTNSGYPNRGFSTPNAPLPGKGCPLDGWIWRGRVRSTLNAELYLLGVTIAMNKPALIDFYKHMEWADATVWRAALTLENARTDVKLREAFHHLHLVQRAFLRVWRDEPRDAPYPTFEDTAALRQWGQTYYAEADAQLA